MTIEPTNAELRGARWIALNREPATDAAKALVAAVTSLAEPHSVPVRSRGATPRPIGPGKRRQFASEFGAILAGLLHGPEIVSAQLGKAGAMWQQAPIGWDAFWSRVRALEAAGLVKSRKGSKGLQTPGAREGHPTRLWAAERLQELADAHGVLVDPDDHWQISKAAQASPRPVKDAHLVRIAPFEGWTSPMNAGVQDSTVGAMQHHVKRLNDHVARASFTGCVFPVFQRKFSGDIRLGGRLYATGGSDTCQNMKRAARAAMRINGEPVAEVDVKASQLSIFLALTCNGAPIPADPYILPDLPREAVKAFCVQSFGAGQLMKQWGDDTEPALRAIAARTMRAALLAAYPAMADIPAILPADLRENPPPEGIEWAAGQHLAYLESVALAAALDYAIARGVVALPLHDALLVPESGRVTAENALRGAYFIHARFEPCIEVKQLAACVSRLSRAGVA